MVVIGGGGGGSMHEKDEMYIIVRVRRRTDGRILLGKPKHIFL
jgi:hypothetical protein